MWFFNSVVVCYNNSVTRVFGESLVNLISTTFQLHVYLFFKCIKKKNVFMSCKLDYWSSENVIWLSFLIVTVLWMWLPKKYIYLCLDSAMIEVLEDTKWVLRIRKSKKDRQHNGQKKEKKTNNDLQNTTQKNKYWAPD